MKPFLLQLCIGLALSWSTIAGAAGPGLWVRIDDSINPGTGAFLIDAMDRAEKEQAAYLVIELNTPGGLLTTTRKIVQKMLATPVPIVIWVGPAGARAGSAGALITFAADVAAMAPNTNIGAAHPVQTGDADKKDAVMTEKITNDTAAFAESLAKAKNRNTKWAIESVRHSASVSAEEALKLKVIDFIAADRVALLNLLQGRELPVAKGAIARLPQDAPPLVDMPMTLRHRAVSFFSSPEIAYLILSLGGLCLWIELANPGLLLPGILGVLCVLVSLVSFEAMPIDHGALALMIAGFAMFVAEVFVTSHGLLALGGGVAFLVGSLFLMNTSAPQFQISLAIILPTVAVLAGSVLVLSYVLLRARRLPPQSGASTLVGQTAVVKEAVGTDAGMVLIEGELWQARSSETITEGSRVRVTAVDGLVLTVKVERT